MRRAGISLRGFHLFLTFFFVQHLGHSAFLPGCSWNIGRSWRGHGTGKRTFRIARAFYIRCNALILFFRTDQNKPFAIDRQKPEGAGFYSEGLSYKEFKVFKYPGFLSLWRDRKTWNHVDRLIAGLDAAAPWPAGSPWVPGDRCQEGRAGGSVSGEEEADGGCFCCCCWCLVVVLLLLLLLFVYNILWKGATGSCTL